MSSEAKKPDGEKKEGEAAAAPKKPSAVGGLLKILLPALLAAGAAYGGTRFASAKSPPAAAAGADAHGGGEGHGGSGDHGRRYIPKPPGPTLPLEPFLVTVFDANKKSHAMKMSLAIEFDAHSQTHDDPKNLVPRIRDAILAHLRTLSHEQVADSSQLEKIRTDLLEKCRNAGAMEAEKVLVTDFVVQ